MSALARLRSSAHLLCLVVFAACSSEPAAKIASPAEQEPYRPRPRPEPAVSGSLPNWAATALFAAHVDGGVLAVDGATGNLRDHALPGQYVVDLNWDPVGERLLAAVLLPEAEGGTVVALSLTEEGLVESSESPPFDGELRILAGAAGILLLNHFDATSWQLLDPHLSPSAPGRAVVTPTGLRPLRSSAGSAWLALDTTGASASGYEDALVRVEHSATRFSAQFLAFSAPDRPESRLVQGENSRNWIARKPDEAAWVELGSYDINAPSVPSFNRIDLAAPLGPLIDATFVPPGDRVALLLGGSESHLALIDDHVVTVPVPGGAIPELLFPRKMVWQKSTDRLWVATELGLTAFAASQDGWPQVAHITQARGPVAIAQ